MHRIVPDIDDRSTWVSAIQRWSSEQGAALLELGGQGSADSPVPRELLLLIAESSPALGQLSFNGAHLPSFDWSGLKFVEEVDFGDAKFHGTTGFKGAKFSSSASFRGTEFLGHVDFGDVEFSQVANFARSCFCGPVDLSSTSFVGPSSFKNARFGSTAYFYRSVFNGDADFSHTTFVGTANYGNALFRQKTQFQSARFEESAYFSAADFNDDVRFEYAEFEGRAHFHKTTFQRRAQYNGAGFSDEATFTQSSFQGAADYSMTAFLESVDFAGSIFAGDLNFDECATPSLSLSGSIFGGTRHELVLGSVASCDLQVSAAIRVEGDLVIRIDECVAFNAAGITVRAPVSLLAKRAVGPGGALTSLENADITEPFRVGRRIDLSNTVWGDHDLTSIDLADLATLPREARFSNQLGERVRQWLPGSAFSKRHRLSADVMPLSRSDLRVLENNYRDLRRQLEVTGNVHEANDLYYGEMEARRRQLPYLSPNRWLLETYRLISGYGTRAWSAVLAWILSTVLATELLLLNGVDIAAERVYSWSETWRFSIEASLSLFRPSSAPFLSSAELGLMIVLRILGPTLLALAAIALRNQTKR